MSDAARLVMVVDDDDALRESICELLEDDGYATIEMDGAASALARLANGAPKPAVILLDLMMPGMNGWEFREHQLRDGELANIPVVVMTASRDLQGISAAEVLYKPLTRSRLLDAISQHARAAQADDGSAAAPRTPSEEPGPESAGACRRAELASASECARAVSESHVSELRAGLAPEHGAEVLSALHAATEAAAREQRTYAPFMQAPMAICVLRGESLVFEMANRSFSEVVRQRPLHGKTFSEGFPELQGQGFEELLREVMRTGESFSGQEVLVRLDRNQDGEPEDGYFSFICSPIRGETGAIDRIMAVVSEVTDQVSVRHLIEHSEERFRRIVTQVQAGIAQTDASGRFVLTNERYREIVGRSEAELAQLGWLDLTHPDDRAAAAEQFRRLIEEGIPFVLEQRTLKPDGSIVWVQDSVSRVYDQGGRPQGVVAVSIDVTRRKFAEQALLENEERYRTLVEQVVDYAIFRTDAEGRATTWNEGVRRVLGFEEPDFVGADVTDLIFMPEDVLAGVPRRELEAAAKHGRANSDRWMRRKNGERFFAAGVTSALRGADGRLLGFTKVMRDQTEKLRAEEAAAHLAAIVTSSDDAIISTDLAANIRTWNQAAQVLYGYSAEEAIGRSVAILIPDDRVDEEPEILQRIARGEVVDHYETVRRRKDGSLVDVSLTVSPVRDSRGAIIGGAKIARDITEQKRLQREREARVAEVERSLAFSERFVGILGHDLRNPLGAIVTASELLLRRETNERLARPIQRIQASAQRMSRMIEQILDLTRARIGGGIPIVPTPVDLHALTTSLVDELVIAAPQAILVDGAGDLQGTWDGDRLAQVVSNLVGNAVEHGATDEPIRVILDGSDPDTVELSVWNAGVIPGELLPALFDPFVGAAANARSRRSKGLGLGLYIVEQIVLSHGGRVEVRSADGGTEFLVSLPRVAVRRPSNAG